MFTIKYKGWFIHGYIDKPECTVSLPKGGHWATCKSLLAAKRLITKHREWVRG
jgi:hypothetical protein